MDIFGIDTFVVASLAALIGFVTFLSGLRLVTSPELEGPRHAVRLVVGGLCLLATLAIGAAYAIHMGKPSFVLIPLVASLIVPGLLVTWRADAQAGDDAQGPPSSETRRFGTLAVSITVLALAYAVVAIWWILKQRD